MRKTAYFAGKHVHLMGIGGCGVSALVPLLHDAGATVDGCDLASGRTVARLREDGVDVTLGHDPAHVERCDMVVHTGAVSEEHIELRAARARGLPVLGRSACLAELMRGSRTVAVAGSHGKTSTTWMLAHLLTAAGCDPMVMVGGSVSATGFNGGRVGSDDLFIAEVDESDGGFAHVAPTVAVVTNLEPEHTRHYGGFAPLCRAFGDWLAQVPAHGAVVTARAAVPPDVFAGLRAPVIDCSAAADTGGSTEPDYRAHEVALAAEGSSCRVRERGEDIGTLRVPLPGRHMVHDALLALAAARLLVPDLRAELLAGCERVRRRFTCHGWPDGVRVVEDYAHHPTEIAATVAAAALGGGRVHAIFQPHRYSRTADCFEGFIAAFAGVEALAILPVYAAGEEPIAGAGGRDLAEAVARQRGDRRAMVQYVRQPDAAVAYLAARARPGDTCLVLGAGDVNRCCRPLVEALA
ncbi:MAG: UDP-N-acetylmuramate--L-alanine ligase [Planctomycetota bacterium]